MNTINLCLRGRWLLALFASLFLAVGASAQNEVRGRVTADGQPLVGASVIIKGTTTGTRTGAGLKRCNDSIFRTLRFCIKE